MCARVAFYEKVILKESKGEDLELFINIMTKIKEIYDDKSNKLVKEICKAILDQQLILYKTAEDNIPIEKDEQGNDLPPTLLDFHTGKHKEIINWVDPLKIIKKYD